MTVRLNAPAFEHARRLIEEGKFVADERDAWSEHHPSTQMENEFIQANGFSEYSRWFLALDSRYGESTKRYYDFPFGDFERVYRSAILAAESRAGQRKHFCIVQAVGTLLELIDNRLDEGAPPRSSVDRDGD